MFGKIFRATALATAAVMVWGTAALADDVVNNVVADTDGNKIVEIEENDTATVTFKLVAATGAPDSAGCNAIPTAQVTVNLSVPAGVTATPSSFNFTDCTPNAGGEVAVDFTSGTAADYSIGVTSVTGGKIAPPTATPTYDTSGAGFTLRVTEPSAPADTTPPVITPNITGTLGNNGWYVSDVMLSWTVVDNESAITSTSGCGPTTINTDTTGTMITCSATSAGGTSSESVTIKRDATPPTVGCPTPAPSFLLNQSPANVTASVSDATSLPVATTVSGTADTSSVGSKFITLNGEDNAGNTNSANCAYGVSYKFNGFFAPVDNPNWVNKVKAGQAIPLKWRLLDANDVPYTTLSSATMSVEGFTCSLGTSTDLLEEVAPGASGLQNLGDGYYQLNWKSPTSYAKSCKTLKLNIGEGSTHNANFEFTK